MKKSIITALAILVGIISANAQAPYKHSIGVTLGSNNGIVYKVMPTSKFAISVDLSYGLTASKLTGFYFTEDQAGRFDVLDGTYSISDISVNPNFMFEKNLGSSNTYFFVGGGIGLGAAKPFAYKGESTQGYFDTMAKVSTNAIVGLEWKFKAPIALGFDFRPGVSSLMRSANNAVAVYGYYDWKINFSARYCF